MPLAKRVPQKIAKRLNRQEFMSRKGKIISNTAYFTGAGMVGTQLLSGKINTLTSIGSGAMLLGVAGQELARRATKAHEKQLLALVGKRRVAKNVFDSAKGNISRTTLLLISAAKTKTEQETVKKFITNKLTPKDRVKFIQLLRKARRITQQKEITTLLETVRAGRGIKETTITSLANKVKSFMSERKNPNDVEITRYANNLLLPHVTFFFLNKYNITDIRSRKRLYALIKQQSDRYFRKITHNPNVTPQELKEDIVMRETAQEIKEMLKPRLGMTLSLFEEEFTTTVSKTTNQIIDRALMDTELERRFGKGIIIEYR